MSGEPLYPLASGLAGYMGCFTHKKYPPPKDPRVGLCLGPYGGPGGGGAVPYERSTPVKSAQNLGKVRVGSICATKSTLGDVCGMICSLLERYLLSGQEAGMGMGGVG